MVEDRLFQKMAFIVGNKRERDVGRLENRQSGKFRVSEGVERWEWGKEVFCV